MNAETPPPFSTFDKRGKARDRRMSQFISKKDLLSWLSQLMENRHLVAPAKVDGVDPLSSRLTGWKTSP